MLIQGFIQWEGGGGDGGLPPPLLNQHKYVVLKHKQQQSDCCCSKKVYTCSKTPRIFPKVYSSGQNIGNRHCFLVGVPDGFLLLRIILYETLANSIVFPSVYAAYMLHALAISNEERMFLC